MGRKRKTGQGLPPYVYLRRGWYAWREYKNGKLGTPVQLVPADSPISAVWAAYERLQETGAYTLNQLMHEYADAAQVAPRTRADYLAYARILAGTKLGGGSKLGALPAADITPLAVRRYLDRFKSTPTAANRRVQFLKAAFGWAFERGKVEQNPCIGVKLHKTPPRERYVTDAEYAALVDLAAGWACSGRYPYLWQAIELAYLLRARRAEVCGLQVSQITDGRLVWSRAKGSRPEATRITTRLAFVIAAGDPRSPWLVSSKRKPISKNAFDSAWQRLMDEALARGLVRDRFTFHDLKAKGASDHATGHTGHRSEKARQVYLRKPDEVDPSA